MEQLVDNMECDIPDGMVETQVDKLMDDYAMRLQSQGMSMDDYLKMMGMTPEMLRASARPTALRRCRRSWPWRRWPRPRTWRSPTRSATPRSSAWPSSTSSPPSR